MAVEQHAVKRGIGAENGDLFAFAKAAVDADAGDVRQRFRDVAIRELADRLGRDHVNDGIGVALHRDGAAQALADAGNDDIVARRGVSLWRGGRCGRRCVRRCGLCHRRSAGETGKDARGQQNGMKSHKSEPSPIHRPDSAG
ncbi:hypothetical protein D9M73_128260 [compost metagenome]